MKISKVFHWEMGHRLPNHQGSCRNIHGHSYELEVQVEGSLNNEGMVIDFQDISAATKPVVKELDHAFMCSRDDPEVLAFIRQSGLKLVEVDFPSTTENLCRFFADKLQPVFSERDNIELFRVIIRETASSEAILEVDLRGNP